MSRKVLLCSLSLLMMHVSLHSGFAIAEADDGLAPVATHTISWQMLPGDSINRLAVLFYPRNTNMQQRFVAKTLALNRKRLGVLNPAMVYDEASAIVIPDLKYLSMQANPPKAKPVAAETPGMMLKVGNLPVANSDNGFLAKIQAEYDYLVKQNLQLKEELVRLNQHLAGLQKTLGELFVLARKILAQQSAAETSPSSVSTNMASQHSGTEDQAKQDQAKNDQTKNDQLKSEAPATDVADQSSSAQNQAVATVDAPPAPTQVATAPVESAAPVKPASQPSAAKTTQAAVKKIVNMATKPAPAAGKEGWSLQDALSFKKNDALFPLILTVVALLTVILLIGSWFMSWYQNNKNRQQEIADEPHSVPPAQVAGFVLTENGINETPESVIARAGDMMANDQSAEAIALLEMYIRELPTHSVYPWLYLLELRHKLAQKAEFDELVERLHNTFNVQPPAWEDRQSGIVVDSSLEDFPHIVTELERLWASDDAVHYLTELQLDNRRGERTGFSIEVLKEITVLQKILETRGQYTGEPSHKPELRLVSSA